MTKEITMVVTCKTAQRRYRYHGNRPLVRVPERVDCEKLSAPARLIAESILTTARDDDMSLIWVTGPSIYERLQSEGKTEEANCALRNFGDLANSPDSIVWRFDALRLDESTEQYFERQVDAMLKAGARLIKTRTGEQYPLVEQVV